MPHATVLEAPTPGPFLGGVGASALAGTAMASVAVAAASSEPATRAEVQDILECPSLSSRGNPRPPLDRLLGLGPLRCGDYARFHRFPAAFLSLAAVHGRWLT